MDLTKILKPGDKVWTIQDGWTSIQGVDSDSGVIVTTDLKYYDVNGICDSDKFPSLFLKEQVFDLSVPETVFEQDELVWALLGDPINPIWVPSYYDHKDREGYHCVFRNQLRLKGNGRLLSVRAYQVRKWEDSPFKLEN